MLTWQDKYADPYLKWGIWADRRGPNPDPASPFQVVAPSDLGDRQFPAVACGKSTCLFAWQHQREANPLYYDIWARLLYRYADYLPLLMKQG
jgi:hypothetical protein